MDWLCVRFRLSPLMRLGGVVLAPVLAALVLPAPVRSQTTVAAGSDSFLQRGGGVLHSVGANQAMTIEVSWTAAMP